MARREKLITEYGYKKNQYKVDENLFCRMAQAMKGNLHPVESYIQKQGCVKRGDDELYFTDVRVYFKESKVLTV